MFARKFIDHVDTHADQLCNEFMHKIEGSNRCIELLHKVPVEEHEQSIRAIYRGMTDWLLNGTDLVTQDLYVNLGMRRAQQGVPLCELFWAMCLNREYFWEYMERETLLDEPVDFWGGAQLLHSIYQFFDRAFYFVIMGYQTVTKDEGYGATTVSASK